MVRIDDYYRTYLQGVLSDSASSGSDDDEDNPDAIPKFVNEKAAGRYERSIFRHILVERKFEAPTLTFEEAIRHYGWEPLTLAPAMANVEIAREYYVNANTGDSNWFHYYGVYLRGTYLRVTSNTINQHFHLPEYPDGEYGEYEQLMAAGNVDDLIESVGLPGASWVRNARSEAVFVKTKDLTA